MDVEPSAPSIWEKAEKKSGGQDDKKGFTNQILGNFAAVCPGVNIKELVKMVQYDLTLLGINLSWKPTQMKDSATQITIYGVDDNHYSKECLQFG